MSNTLFITVCKCWCWFPSLCVCVCVCFSPINLNILRVSCDVLIWIFVSVSAAALHYSIHGNSMDQKKQNKRINKNKRKNKTMCCLPLRMLFTKRLRFAKAICAGTCAYLKTQKWGDDELFSVSRQEAVDANFGTESLSCLWHKKHINQSCAENKSQKWRVNVTYFSHRIYL